MWLAVGGLLGCPLGATTPDGTPGAATDGGEGGETDGVRCPPNPDFTCEALGCTETDDDCGPLRRFDQDGCLRPSCTTDGDCPRGQACFSPYENGICDGWVSSCESRGDECVCTVQGNAFGAAYCVDASDLPAPDDGDACDGGDTGGDTGGDSTECGAPGSNSEPSGDECICLPGFDWCDLDDLSNFSCCEVQGPCPDPDNEFDPDTGLCYCRPGLDWCRPDDPDDYTCCEPGANTG